jgi:hypothetical protein
MTDIFVARIPCLKTFSKGHALVVDSRQILQRFHSLKQRPAHGLLKKFALTTQAAGTTYVSEYLI